MGQELFFSVVMICQLLLAIVLVIHVGISIPTVEYDVGSVIEVDVIGLPSTRSKVADEVRGSRVTDGAICSVCPMLLAFSICLAMQHTRAPSSPPRSTRRYRRWVHGELGMWWVVLASSVERE